MRFYAEPYGWLYADPSYGIAAVRAENDRTLQNLFAALKLSIPKPPLGRLHLPELIVIRVCPPVLFLYGKRRLKAIVRHHLTEVRLGILSVPLRVPFKTALRSVSSVEDIIVEIHTDSGALHRIFRILRHNLRIIHTNCNIRHNFFTASAEELVDRKLVELGGYYC